MALSINDYSDFEEAIIMNEREDMEDRILDDVFEEEYKNRVKEMRLKAATANLVRIIS